MELTLLSRPVLRGDREDCWVSCEHCEDPNVPCPPTAGFTVRRLVETIMIRRRNLNNMRDPSDESDGNHHQKVWEILPWYVNGTLDSHEHELVARHILSCQSCADEVARCQSIATAVRSSKEAARTPSPENLARLNGAHRPCKHVGRSGALADSCSRVDRKNPPCISRRRRLYFVGHWPRRLRRSSCWPRLLYGRLRSLLLSLYRTLSDAGSGPEPGRVHLQVVFSDDITEREIRTLLGSIGATIVAGPTPMAVYTCSFSR